jgi:UDP-glucose 4-epimerase
LGSGTKTTYRDLIVSLAKVMGKEDTLKIEELPGTPGDMMGCYADVTKIKNNLKYNPKYNLIEGIRDMYTWVSKTI